MDFWRQTALDALQCFIDWGDEDKAPILIEMSYFNARYDSRRAIPTGRKLHSNERTVMRRLLEGSVPEISNRNTPIDINTYVRDCGRKLPFVVNISGIVSTVGDEVATQSGKPMASFRLHIFIGS